MGQWEERWAGWSDRTVHSSSAGPPDLGTARKMSDRLQFQIYVCETHKQTENLDVLTNSSFIIRTQSLSILVGAPNNFVKAFSVLYLKGGPAT